jgi:hypothetical protein
MIAAVTAAIGLAGSTVSIQANASCYASSFDTASSAVRANAFAQFAGGIKAAQQGRAATANVTALPNFNAPSAHGSIIGYWKFAFTAPDGVTGIDWGFQQWHSDGTELTNSGGQLPATGNFCTGVWEQAGRGAYRLNHWAIAWNLPGTILPTLQVWSISANWSVSTGPAIRCRARFRSTFMRPTERHSSPISAKARCPGSA